MTRAGFEYVLDKHVLACRQRAAHRSLVARSRHTSFGIAAR